jgi:hypothetical protein
MFENRNVISATFLLSEKEELNPKPFVTSLLEMNLDESPAKVIVEMKASRPEGP